MSVELAAISSLRKTLNDKLGFVKEFTLTAGENLTKGALLNIGTDGKAYLQYRPDKNKVLDEIALPLNEANSLTSIDDIKQVDDTRILVLYNNADWKIDADNTWKLNTVLVYDDNGTIKTTEVNIKSVRGYNSDGANNRYEKYFLFGNLHQVDAYNYIIFYVKIRYFYDGNNWRHDGVFYYRTLTIDTNDNSISLGDETQLDSFSNDGRTGDWNFQYKIFLWYMPYSADTCYFALNGANKTFYRIKINTSTLDVTLDNTNTSATCDLIYNAVIPLNDGDNQGSLAISLFTSGNNKYLVTSATADDVTAVTINDGDDDDFTGDGYYASISIPFDINKVLMQDIENDDNLYILEYNTDGSVKSKSKVYNVNVDLKEYIFLKAYDSPRFIPYKDNDGNIWIGFTGNSKSNIMYQDPTTNNIRQNTDLFIFKFYQDSNGDYYGELVYIIENLGRNIQSAYPIYKINDTFLIITDAYRSYDNANEIIEEVYLDIGNSIPTYPVNLYANSDVNAGDTFTAVTNEPTIPLLVRAGEKAGQFIGIKDNVALPILIKGV